MADSIESRCVVIVVFVVLVGKGFGEFESDDVVAESRRFVSRVAMGGCA